jgi:hypothetical protein
VNAAAEHQLEQIVRRVIRPIVATRARKRLIEEELLAHVIAVYEQEFNKFGEVQAALDQTRRRFGVPEEVRSQLQSSIPTLECWLLALERNLLMSRWLWLIAIFALAVGPAILLPAMAKFRMDGSLTFLPLAVGALMTLGGVCGICYGAARGLARVIK